MMDSSKRTRPSLEAKRASALQGLLRSLLLNVVAPYLLYRALSSHFEANSVMPLAISGLLPIINGLYGLIGRKTVDVFALFASEGVIVSIVITLLAKSQRAFLIGRSSQSAIMGLVFLASFLMGKPLVLYMARQFSIGDDPASLARFDQVAKRDDALKAYGFMTVVWALALCLVSGLEFAMIFSLPTNSYLLLSPFVTYGSYALLVIWTFRHAHKQLGHHYVAPADSAI